MEDASEMIVQSCLNDLKIAEIPTTLKKDGRTRKPHLKTVSDGWRHLKFLLMYSPQWLFLIPGIILIFLGLAGNTFMFFRKITVGAATLGVHSRLYLGAMIVIGLQMIIFAMFAKLYAINSGMNPRNDKFAKFVEKLSLEKILLLGVILTIIGIALTIYVIIIWKIKGFGRLNPDGIMPITIPAVYLIIIGVQMAFASFILGILNIEYKRKV